MASFFGDPATMAGLGSAIVYGEYAKKGEGLKEMASDLASGYGPGKLAEYAVAGYDWMMGPSAPETPKDLADLDAAIQQIESAEHKRKFIQQAKRYAGEFLQGAKSYFVPTKQGYTRSFGRLVARFGYRKALQLWRRRHPNQRLLRKGSRYKARYHNPRREYAYRRAIGHNRISQFMPGYRRFRPSYGRRPVLRSRYGRSRFVRSVRPMYRRPRYRR